MTVRVLVVDDSPTMRAMIAALLNRHPEIEVVGQADRVEVARAIIRELNPDVVTLDVEMPGMNGIDFLEKIMRLRPTPVVMVSTLTARGTDATLRALELGAVDCYAKPSANARDFLAGDNGRLAAMVVAAAASRPQARALGTVQPRPAPVDFAGNGKVVAIGSSTGGVEALTQMLGSFPANCPPTLVVQHMPATFTRAFATRLNTHCAPTIVEAEEAAVLEPGHVYIAPGGSRHMLVKNPARPRIRLQPGEPVNGHSPSVDMLFRSVAECVGGSAVGVILTGMGDDGARGLLEMRRKGCATVGQDRATSVVYGMPKVADEIGAVAEVLPLPRIAGRVLERCSR